MTLPPITDEDLTAWAMQSGAKIERAGMGAAYPELVLRSWNEPGNPELHLHNLRKFAGLVAAAAVAAERERIAVWLDKEWVADAAEERAHRAYCAGLIRARSAV